MVLVIVTVVMSRMMTTMTDLAFQEKAEALQHILLVIGDSCWSGLLVISKLSIILKVIRTEIIKYH